MAVSLPNHAHHVDRYTSSATPTSANSDGSTSRTIAPTHGLRTPAARRAPTHQNTDIRPNAMMNHRPDHLIEHARPSDTPAPNRHQRKPSVGPNGEWAAHPPATASPSRLRTCSRSATRQPNAASTNSAMKMSSIPMRDCTWLTPSAISSTPAMAASRSERVSLRAIRTTISTMSVPATAEENRQPKPS